MADDYDVIPDHCCRVTPGNENFNERVRTKYGFVLPNPPRDQRQFATPRGRAQFIVRELEYLAPPESCLVLQTMRSHYQYNTTLYGLDGRYAGIKNRRRYHLRSRTYTGPKLSTACCAQKLRIIDRCPKPKFTSDSGLCRFEAQTRD